jgi:uncharacterized protein (DUF885 family)
MTTPACWSRRAGVPFVLLLSIACSKSATSTTPSGTAGPGDSSFATLAHDIMHDVQRRHPTLATSLGVHTWDSVLDDYTSAAIDSDAVADSVFRTQLTAIDSTALSLDRQLDRQALVHAMDAEILDDRVIRSWAKNADAYSSGITNAAYVIMEREFAPAAQRLASLVSREQSMPAALAAARVNLVNPPRVFTQIAIEQVDGDIHFFQHDVPAAFDSVHDNALQARFTASNTAVVAALTQYKAWLQHDLLPRSAGDFALGATTYAQALEANEMINVPLDSLLRIAEADRQRNEAAFVATAHLIDSTRSADAVLASLQSDHPPADSLLQVTQATLDSLRQFIVDHHILTIPPSQPVPVQETPPFMRATTTASMDPPGPFETANLQAHYNMTLPDPRWPASEQEEYMKGWYYPAISNVSVHEVYPGHYLQFLYTRQFPTDVRKMFYANTNVEGWAHYCEQMMLDEGFHDHDPRYRLAQLQDALLRDVRFIVGIKLHTAGMTVDQATALFQAQGHQPHPIAVEEALRGTGDPLYGYYTMGKLMILKLRADYRAKLGNAYTLAGFHDDFLKPGMLPLPLMRRKLLGTTGDLF